MSHARTRAGRARVLGAALVGVCVWWSGERAGPREVAAAPAKRVSKRVSVPLQVIGEQSADGPMTETLVSAQRIDEPGPALEVTVVGEAGAIELEPGVWSLIARAPGRMDRQQVFTLMAPGRGEAAAPVRFVLAIDRVPVVLRLGPPEAIAAGVRWSLVREGERGRDYAGRESAAAREVLLLEPGAWKGEVSAPGFVTQEFTWTVGDAASGAPPVIELQRIAAAPVVAPPAPQRPPGPDPRLGLGLGLGLAGAASLGLGVGLLVQHREAYARFDAAPNNEGFVAALGASAAGAGLVGGGLGLGVVALTARFMDGPKRGTSQARGRARDRVLWAELAVGGGVALFGAAWYAREWQDVQKDLYDAAKDPEMDGTPSGHDAKSQRRETAAAAFIGAGAGLMIGAGVALVTRTVLRLRGRSDGETAGNWALAGGPGQVGLGLHGRF